jgi:threonylcarbamoyladenosine tRNA methylthiotransferase MtaB
MKIFLDSIGCRLNQSEIERYSAHFRMAGHSLVGSAAESDLVVINTCSVTSKAAADSRSKTRQIHRQNPFTKIVLTGCWSSLEEVNALELPGVIDVIQNDRKDNLVPLILDLPPDEFDQEPVARQPIPGSRMRTRAFIKAQDGCDNQCTFCITTVARGPSKSVPPERVIREVRAAVAGGVQEAVLTGVQLTSYGIDLIEAIDLGVLVEMILERTDLPRLRLSSLEPWNLPGNFLRVFENPRLCRQLHLPLQSGSASVLRRMVRPITPEAYANVIEAARDRVPDISITTDIIAGFPGETDGEFEESLAFIQKMNFSDAHIFTYSPRTGTPAMRIPQHVPSHIARDRSRSIRTVIDTSSRHYANRFIGTKLTVLWESTTATDGDCWEAVGLSDNYLRVKSIVPSDLLNMLSSVRITEVGANGIQGEVVDPSSEPPGV